MQMLPFILSSVLLPMVSLFCPVSPTLAQETPFPAPVPVAPAPSWEELQQKSPKIWTCHVVWKRVRSSNPIKGAAPDARVAHFLAAAKQAGLSPETTESVAKGLREKAEAESQGRTETSTDILEFVRVGNTVRVNITSADGKDESIEFFDGVNSLFGWTQVQNRKVPLQVSLIRDSSEVLSHSSRRFQAARFLLGIPLEQNFSELNPAVTSQNARLHRINPKEFILEPMEGRSGELVFSYIEGAIVLRAFGDLDILASTRTGEVSLKQQGNLSTISAQGFRKYSGGLWFPSKVIYTAPYGDSEYTLQSAEFNDEVDPTDVRLPAGIQITDRRFGNAVRPVTYFLKDGQLPSDAEIKKRLGLKGDEDVSKFKVKQDQTKQTRSIPVSEAALPLLGLLCMGFGAALWRQAKKMES